MAPAVEEGIKGSSCNSAVNLLARSAIMHISWILHDAPKSFPSTSNSISCLHVRGGGGNLAVLEFIFHFSKKAVCSLQRFKTGVGKLFQLEGYITFWEIFLWEGRDRTDLPVVGGARGKSGWINKCKHYLCPVVQFIHPHSLYPPSRQE